MRTIDRILLIRLSSIGDILLASPLIYLLNQKYPKAKLDFVIFKEYSDLVRNHPSINRVFEFDKAEGFRELSRIKKIIKSQKYDFILDIHANLRSHWITLGISWFSTATRIYRVRKQKLARFFLVKFKVNLYQYLYGRIIPVWEKYINTAQKLGINPKSHHRKPDLYLPESVTLSAENILNQHHVPSSYITVAPGARHYTKRWPARYYAAVINRIFRDAGRKTLLVGGPSEIETVRTIQEKVDNNAILSLAGEISLLETAAIINKSNLLISNDSGLMHVGSAMGVPLIAIFGSTVEEFGFFPEGPDVFVAQNHGLYCRPCSHIGRSTCPIRHFNCLEEISPEEIIKVAKELLKEKRKG
jgi:heptosyltransferase-2